jgi:hypothetical protein
MAESGTLKRLVSGLTLEERKTLLEKLNGASDISGEPLYELSPEASPPQIGDQYAKLPWYSRLWLFILGIFKSRPPVKLFEDRQVAALGRQIEDRWPGFYDYQRGTLLPPFYTAISELKEGARFFYTALDLSVNQDKGAFYAFLGSLEMEDIHRRLQSDTDPEEIVKGRPGISDVELRQEALRALDETMTDISDTDRQGMYANVRSLQYLKELSSFLFDRVIMAFGFDHGVSGYICPVRLVRDMLNTLNRILFSLQAPPSMVLLESMFVFILQEKEGEPGFDINREIQILLARAEESLRCVKGFNAKVPLTRILRCASRDMALSPSTITGGEDWFALYQDHWKKYVDARLGDYLGNRRRRELLKTFGDFFREAPLLPLDNAASEANPGGFPLNGAFALSFLLTFRREIFLGSLNRILKPIYAEGEFVRRENRVEFSERYEQIEGLEADIGVFSTDLSPDHGFGKRYAQVRSDMSSLASKRRKTQMILDEAAEKAGTIISGARASLQGMVNLFEGIIAEEPGLRYGPLSNLDKLEARSGGISTTDLIAVSQKFQRALKILDDIDLMEAGK